MNESEAPSHGLSKDLASALERLVEIKYLVLVLTIIYYIDIWMLKVGVSPMELTIEKIVPGIKSSTFHEAVLFLVLYSLLMAGFFPFVRKILVLLRMYFQDQLELNINQSSKQLSNWSFALISFSLYDAFIGIFYSSSAYSGLTVYIFSLFSNNGVVEAIIRLSVIGLFFYCISQALKAYEDDFEFKPR